MPTLKHSIADWCFYKPEYDPETFYGRLKDIGVHAVELVDPSRWEAARNTGLKILNTQGVAIETGLNRQESHQSTLPILEDTIRTAQSQRIRQVVLFSGKRDNIPDQVGLRNCITAVRNMASTAQSAGVTLLFEMLNSHDHPGYQGDNPEFGFQLARAVDSPAVKVLYDVYHAARMGLGMRSILNDLTSNMDIIAHVHIAGAPDRKFPGASQRIDYQSVVRTLRMTGYNGYIGHEFLPSKDPFDEIAESMALFESYV